MAEYRLTEKAEEDLIAIWLWTAGRWSEAQADRYLAALEACCEKIAAGHLQGRPVEGLEQVRFHRCERHLVFCTAPGAQPLAVLAILHARMDLPARLRDRLDRM